MTQYSEQFMMAMIVSWNELKLGWSIIGFDDHIIWWC